MSVREVGPRLGRGLAALMGEAEPSGPPSDIPGAPITALPITMLEPGPFQPRASFEPASLKELINSIRTQGILQPLLARPHPITPGHYQIIAGERRWRAAQQAGLREVPVLIRTLADPAAMAASLVENLQRQDLNPIEEAEGFRRLIDEFGLTQEQLGDAVGKSRSHVANTLRLMQLPSTVLAEVRKGSLSAGHARALLSHPNPAEAALQVIAKGLNVRQTEALTSAQAPTGSADKSAVERDPETESLERDLSERLGLRVRISFNGRSGNVTLHYRSLDQLDGILTLLSRD